MEYILISTFEDPNEEVLSEPMSYDNAKRIFEALTAEKVQGEDGELAWLKADVLTVGGETLTIQSVQSAEEQAEIENEGDNLDEVHNLVEVLQDAGLVSVEADEDGNLILQPTDRNECRHTN